MPEKSLLGALHTSLFPDFKSSELIHQMAAMASSAVLFLLAWGLYVMYSAVWRLYLSPIARFPGPKLAALTQWYELYYDLVKGGQYVWKIGQLHEEYGTLSSFSS